MATAYQDDYMKTALRLPRDLHSRIQEAAAASGKSLNAELISRLQQSFEKSDADEGRVLALEAEADSQRALARQFKAVAQISDDVRTLLATILLSTLHRLPPDDDRAEEDRRLAQSTAEWLSARDQLGAVHSLLKLIDGSDAGKVELLRNFASHLEDLADSAPMKSERTGSVNKIILVGNIGRHFDEEVIEPPPPRLYGPQRSSNARKPKP